MEYKIKDSSPENSAALFKKTLEDIGVSFAESFFEPVEGAVSLALTDVRHGISVNGKGVNRAFCLASAYGEAIERIQAQMAYSGALSQEAKAYLGFCDWPDEQLLPISAVNDDLNIARDIRACLFSGCDSQEFFTRYIGGDKMAFVPYYAVRAKKSAMLPEKAVSLMCGSNGLASGNTREEALCQALGEILERYAKFYIYRHYLTPPIIPDSYIAANAPKSRELIDRIQAKSGYRVLVRDASLGNGLPVVNVLLIDAQNERYFTKFGAHPCFFAALERCLTELLQGYFPGNAASDAAVMSEWSIYAKHSCNRDLMSAYRSDIACVPEPFLGGVPSWEFAPWPNYEGFTNAVGARALLERTLALADEVYIRDIGFLGIPAYRVYAAGVSILPIKYSEKNIRYSELHALLCEFLSRSRETLTQEEKRELILAFESEDTDFGSRSDSFGSISPRAVHALLLYELGEDGRAVEALKGATAQYEKCIRRYIALGMRGVALDARRALMLSFYGEETAARICNALMRRENALKAYVDPLGLIAMLKASKAEDETRAQRARVENISALHMRLKAKMKSGMPEIEHTANLLLKLTSL